MRPSSQVAGPCSVARLAAPETGPQVRTVPSGAIAWHRPGKSMGVMRTGSGGGTSRTVFAMTACGAGCLQAREKKASGRSRIVAAVARVWRIGSRSREVYCPIIASRPDHALFASLRDLPQSRVAHNRAPFCPLGAR